jgi:hypothetical protein
MRGRDPQRHADQGRDQGREQHQGQGLQHRLPIALVQDQQQGDRHEHRQRDRTLQREGQQGDGRHQDQRRNRLQQPGQAVDRAVHGVGDQVEHALTMGLHQIDQPAHPWADRQLVRDDPGQGA